MYWDWWDIREGLQTNFLCNKSHEYNYWFSLARIKINDIYSIKTFNWKIVEKRQREREWRLVQKWDWSTNWLEEITCLCLYMTGVHTTMILFFFFFTNYECIFKVLASFGINNVVHLLLPRHTRRGWDVKVSPHSDDTVCVCVCWALSTNNCRLFLTQKSHHFTLWYWTLTLYFCVVHECNHGGYTNRWFLLFGSIDWQ